MGTNEIDVEHSTNLIEPRADNAIDIEFMRNLHKILLIWERKGKTKSNNKKRKGRSQREKNTNNNECYQSIYII